MRDWSSLLHLATGDLQKILHFHSCHLNIDSSFMRISRTMVTHFRLGNSFEALLRGHSKFWALIFSELFILDPQTTSADDLLWWVQFRFIRPLAKLLRTTDLPPLDDVYLFLDSHTPNTP